MSSESGDTPLHGDLRRPRVIDTESLAWTPSPSGKVWRKRLHRVGPAEAGQVTSLVRYEPRSRFPAHEHPDGEEIFVLAGIFSDEHGDWPAGTYLLNPEGVSHTPSSKPGCLLFVKLRQSPGPRRQTRVFTPEVPWQASGEPAGVEVKTLYQEDGFADTVRLERWAAGAAPRSVVWSVGVELFVLEGELVDGSSRHPAGRYPSGTWLRLPPGHEQELESPTGCTLFVKEGGFAYLLDATNGPSEDRSNG